MKIVFMGTPSSAVPSLFKLIEAGHEIVAVYAQPDRPAGRGQKLKKPPTAEFALERKIPVFQPEKLRPAQSIDTFRNLSADLAVVVAYGKILPKEYLTAFPNGAINVHFSLLPKYRGAAPVNWAIINGETITGVTTMLMDEGLDTGDILLQKQVEIGSEETSVTLLERLAVLGGDLLVETIEKLPEIEPKQQRHSEATYARILKKEDGLIDWSLRASEIINRIRGLQPSPGAFSFLNGKRISLVKASEIAPTDSIETPGEVLVATKTQLIISCGHNTALSVLELKPEGKKVMSIKDFLNGHIIEKGCKFSSMN
ncbi:MAG TPA: methionyl-tRNA formyltransferase [Pyrinomonadaceae bacterium]|nr:methionyl-tRNA formyltransferase [Pyrinomonadaceae bacterium]